MNHSAITLIDSYCQTNFVSVVFFVLPPDEKNVSLWNPADSGEYDQTDIQLRQIVKKPKYDSYDVYTST